MDQGLIKLSDYVISYLADKGIKDIFMITGGGAMHLNDSIGNSKDITYYCNHHEQASAMAAECYARLRGIGACNITTGPGGTNTLTGLIGAWLDSVPVIFISGQVKRETIVPKGSHLRQLGIQELNIVDVVSPITKYAVLVEDEKAIKYHLDKAFYEATSGRPGPVWLDIPLDIQAKHINPSTLKGFSAEKDEIFDKKIVQKQVKEVINLLKESKRPVILAGGGIRLSNAYPEFTKLINTLGIPVTTGMSSHDLIPSSHKLFFGRPGGFGERVGNFVIQNSDLVISIGSRLHLWIISYDYKNFARAAKKIIVDIDPAELKKPTI
ncbi:MAG TPA: thiamine pyrophosphate-binding protein, partial [Patescibacteria group bacterium]|nr:thiamine pyrophosphate-binding protein [Patescibacteria group bacterium]